MDVIGNNIANVNTIGYKTSRVVFQDIFSQSVRGGMANNGAISGGTNPVQIGLGIKLSTIDVMHTPAPYQRTDNPFDMMVEGDGYFIVRAPDGGYFYTRAGNFKLDDEGYLTTSDGYYVMGYTGPFSVEPPVEGDNPDDWDPETGPLYEGEPARVIFEGPIDTNYLTRIRLRVDNPVWLDMSETEIEALMGNPDALAAFIEENGPRYFDLGGFAVGDDGSVSVMLNNQKVTIAKVALAVFSNPGGLEKAGNSMYRQTSSSGEAIVTLPLQNNAGRVIGGGLEMSNVDLATEFTDMIVTQRGFQANSRIITVSDTLLEELINLKR